MENFISLLSDKTAVYLYGYDQSIYDFQAIVSSIAQAIGFLALFMAFISFFMPFGKLIVIEALAVIQISFFTIMQFKKIPPTFVGFKNLIYSNGYNDQNMFAESRSNGIQNIFALMGLNLNLLSNFNISLAVFVILPAVVGLTAISIIKFIKKPEDTDKIEDESQLNDKYEPLENKLDESNLESNSSNYVNNRLNSIMNKLKKTIATKNPEEKG